MNLMQKLGERGRFAKVSMYVRISVFAVLVVCTAVIIYKIRAAVPENSFAVMTYNAGGITKKTDTQELADAIRTGGVPDLIFLQEVRRQRDTSRLAALLNLDYYIYAPYKDSKKSGLKILLSEAILTPFLFQEPYAKCPESITMHYGRPSIIFPQLIRN